MSKGIKWAGRSETWIREKHGSVKVRVTNWQGVEMCTIARLTHLFRVHKTTGLTLVTLM